MVGYRTGGAALADWTAALLLVYPPPTAMAADALAGYRGRLVLYAGEPRGGANGSRDFFDALDRDFFLEQTLPLDPFPGGIEKLYVFRRRRWWAWRGRVRAE